MIYSDRIYLLDRTATDAWDLNGDPIGSTDLPQSTNAQMSGDGDLTPWRIRLSLTNTGANGETNHGSLKLRIDEKKTFLQTGPILLSQEARDRYLIEAYIVQEDSNGSQIESKRFRFQLGSPNIDTSKEMGGVLTISLQEIQYRMKEAVSSRELRFVTPYEALVERLLDFNRHQNGSNSIQLALGDNKLPNVENLQRNYLPQGAKPIQNLMEEIFDGLEEPQSLGGVFKDFYFDFDPMSLTRVTVIKADEIGREDTGIVLDPLSSNAITSEQEQSVFTDFVRYKNHVIMRGNPNAGSLPTDHSIFASKWLHAKYRKEWNVSHASTARDNTVYNYLQGETVKVIYNTGIDDNQIIVRYFVALKNIPFPPPHPTISPTSWEEDFITIPSFDSKGQYYENDIVYFNTGVDIRFYRAKQNILAFTLNGFRSGKNNTDVKWGSYLKSDGYLKDPNTDLTHWEDLSSSSSLGDVIPAHATSGFVGYQTYSPWTSDVFDWEKNMVGLKSGSLITNVSGTKRYVGLVPDWNMCKDVYEKQKLGDDFNYISFKWVRKVGVNQTESQTSYFANNHQNNSAYLNQNERYHGQKVIIGSSPSSEFIDDYNQQFSSGSPANRLAEYSVKREIYNSVSNTYVVSAGWIFSDEPVEKDQVYNLDEGNIYYWTGSSWNIGWEYERINTVNSGKPHAIGCCSHPVKDLYKTKGFDGTPNSAIEFRYLWDTETLNIITPFDNNDSKEKLSRLASRGVWLWFWNPFPREPTDSLGIGGLYGSNPSQSYSSTGFTTLNINNNTSDRFQDIRGWNNGLTSEDMGKITGISFKLKVGLFNDMIDAHNDEYFDYLNLPRSGLKDIGMIFWAIDDFQRIWYHKFKLRMNNVWEQVNIPFGDSSVMSLYTAPWDKLPDTLGIGLPIGALDVMRPQKEYTGVRFDWEFVRGWGIMYDGSYEDGLGYYKGGASAGIFNTGDTTTAIESQTSNTIPDLVDLAKQSWEALNNLGKEDTVDVKLKKELKQRYYQTKQATISIDDLYYTKELTVNSDDTRVDNARTLVQSGGGEYDYINLKTLAKARKARNSFYPQFWGFRGVGDVRMRIGKNFHVKGSRIPDYPDQYSDWDSNTTYVAGQRVKFTDGYAYICLSNTSLGESPSTQPTKWDNLNRIVCSSVTHIIDGNGYNMEVEGRRRFVI